MISQQAKRGRRAQRAAGLDPKPERTHRAMQEREKDEAERRAKMEELRLYYPQEYERQVQEQQQQAHRTLRNLRAAIAIIGRR
jgi:hypothetical protein